MQVHASRLRWEMARRGLTVRTLAQDAGLSAPTISAAVGGRPISTASLHLIADTLSRIPPVEIADVLILDAHSANELDGLGG